MFPLLALAALGAVGGYYYGKDKGKKTVVQNNTKSETETTKSTAKNIYNYNYLNDSITGNTLFSSKEKTNRTLFGN